VRKIALILVSIAIGILVPLGVAEIALRFLPVREGLRAVPVDDSNPVFHFTPNRTLTWSRDWNFSIVNRLRVNNSGYVNDQDYLPSAKPLFAVVGDSYVEAAMVPYGETMQGRLARRAGPDMRVYSFAASGAPLSQYLVWAKEARSRWKAEALAILVVGNDFDESLAAYKTGPGFHHYVENQAGELSLRRFDYKPSWARAVIELSALLRYLLLNLEALDRLNLLWEQLPSYAPPARAEDFVGNTSARADQLRLDRSKAAVRAFLRDLVGYAGWQPDRVVFVVDGLRYANDNSAAVQASYFVQMRKFFMAEARQAGFEVIDMDEHFLAQHPIEPAAFQFPTDAHWNGRAHGLAADAIAASATFSRWRQDFDPSPDQR